MSEGNPLRNPYTPQVERIPLVGNHTNRLAAVTKDQIFYNMIPESVTNELTKTRKIYLNKRGGFTVNTTVIGGGGAGRGIYYWPETGKIYTVIANKVYANTTEIGTLVTSTGTCWFTEYKGTAHALVLGDATDLWSISTSDVMTDITDAQLPAGPITPVFFDSYIFVVRSGTPELYNSDVDVHTSWVGDFLSAEQWADDLVACIRHLNYIVGFGTYSFELFFDAENATGSPLERNEGVGMKVGLAARDSIAQIESSVYWVGQTLSGEPSVWTLEGLTSMEVSTESIRKILTNEGSNLASAKAWICEHKGHVLYVLNLNARTLVYDCKEKMWCDWSINTAGAHAILPFNYACGGANNAILALHNTDGKVYKLDPAINLDDAGSTLVEIITDKIDFGTSQQKNQINITLIGDVQASGNVTLDWSDDDYGSFGIDRTLDMTKVRPRAAAGGNFRRRAYRLTHQANTPLRLEALEIDYQLKSI